MLKARWNWKIGIFFLLAGLPFPSPSWALLRATGSTQSQYNNLYCKLGDCFATLTKQAKQGLQLSMNAVESYVTEKKKALAEASDARTDDGPAFTQLDYRVSLVSQMLTECEDLESGANTPRYLLLVGLEKRTDGIQFTLSASTAYSDLVKSVCGKSGDSLEFQACKRSIRIISSPKKEDLLQYLNMLGPGSVKYLGYFGHGTEDAFFLSEKNLLLPRDWLPQLKIGYQQWLKESPQLFDEDLRYLGPVLHKIVAKDGQLKFYTCNSGKSVSRIIKGYVPKGAIVEASVTSMHFQTLPGGGKMLVPDRKGAFRKLSALPLDDYDFKEAEEEMSQAAVSVEPIDYATEGIVLRLALRSTNQTWLNEKKRHVLFDNRESDVLKSVLPASLPHSEDSLNKPLTHRLYETRFAQLLASAKNAADRQFLSNLKRKVDDCISESLRLYYK